MINQQVEYDQALLGEVLIFSVFIGSAEKYIHNYEMLVLIRISETGLSGNMKQEFSGDMKQEHSGDMNQELSIYLKKSY